MKIIILGNSGSGKTWLARQLAQRLHLHIVHLDDVFWKPGGFDAKRGPEEIAQLVRSSKNEKAWIVEGVFGELAQCYADAADCLIWLDIEWPVCRGRLQRRGSESKLHLDRTQSQEGLAKLIRWAEGYDTRTDSRSRYGHGRLFEQFSATRIRLGAQEEVTAYLNGMRTG